MREEEPEADVEQEGEGPDAEVEQEGEGRGSAEQREANQPRFTLQDLQEVLQERNELKTQVFTLQEELAYYKRCTHTHTSGFNF